MRDGRKNNGANRGRIGAGRDIREGEVSVALYHISVVAQMVETHPQTLRMYERMGLIVPQRTQNNIRLYTDEDVQRVRRIQHLTQDLGVNLAGVEVVFKLLEEIERLVAERDAQAGGQGTNNHNAHQPPTNLQPNHRPDTPNRA